MKTIFPFDLVNPKLQTLQNLCKTTNSNLLKAKTDHRNIVEGLELYSESDSKGLDLARKLEVSNLLVASLTDVNDHVMGEYRRLAREFYAKLDAEGRKKLSSHHPAVDFSITA